MGALCMVTPILNSDVVITVDATQGLAVTRHLTSLGRPMWRPEGKTASHYTRLSKQNPTNFGTHPFRPLSAREFEVPADST
jgi:hypothetical protein